MESPGFASNQLAWMSYQPDDFAHFEGAMTRKRSAARMMNPSNKAMKSYGSSPKSVTTDADLSQDQRWSVNHSSDEPSVTESAESAQVEPNSDPVVDITNLLSLPQKEAASILGISESMLCKRFKESTRRKWPYRLLRKIERQIAQIEEKRQLNFGLISPTDQNALDQLLLERLDILSPVQIRVTNHDIAQGVTIASSLPLVEATLVIPSSTRVGPGPKLRRLVAEMNQATPFEISPQLSSRNNISTVLNVDVEDEQDAHLIGTLAAMSRAAHGSTRSKD